MPWCLGEQKIPRVDNILTPTQAFLVEVNPEVLSSLSGVLAPWGPGVLGSWGPGSWSPRDPRHANIAIVNYKSRITNFDCEFCNEFCHGIVFQFHDATLAKHCVYKCLTFAPVPKQQFIEGLSRWLSRDAVT